MLGTVDIGTQLDASYQQSIKRHVEKSLVFSKIIDCTKFCGGVELALKRQD